MSTTFSFDEFCHIMDLRDRGDFHAMTEATLNGIYQAWKNSGTKSWAMLSAFRPGLNKEHQNLRTIRLRARLPSGYTTMIGQWGNDPKEVSFFVPGISMALAQSLCTDFEQDGVAYAGPDTGGKAVMLKKDGATDRSFFTGTFNTDAAKFGSYLSTVRGRSFAAGTKFDKEEAVSAFDWKPDTSIGGPQDRSPNFEGLIPYPTSGYGAARYGGRTTEGLVQAVKSGASPTSVLRKALR